jgi:hypothetical protein
VEKFGASGLAWRRIVERRIVEKLWKHLVNAAPGNPDGVASEMATASGEAGQGI